MQPFHIQPNERPPASAGGGLLAQGLLTFIDTIFPVHCAACGATVVGRVLPLCSTCLRGLPRADRDGVETAIGALPATAGRLDSVFAMWAFEKGGALQKLQHALKYGNRPVYGRWLGALFASELADRLGPVPVDAVVPIPLHRARLLERGYNQSRWLAEGIAAGLALEAPHDLLRRRRATRPQTSLGVYDRWANVAGAFEAAGPFPVPSGTALLVDDVLTTGATAAAAAQALREAGAGTVHLATLAYASR